MIAGQPLTCQKSQPLVRHHTGGHVVRPQFRHLRQYPSFPLRPSNAVAVAALLLQVTLLRPRVVSKHHDAIHLKAQKVGQVNAAARADTPLTANGAFRTDSGDLSRPGPERLPRGSRFSYTSSGSKYSLTKARSMGSCGAGLLWELGLMPGPRAPG